MTEFNCEECAAFGKIRCVCAEIEEAKNPRTKYFTTERGISEEDGCPYIAMVDVTEYVEELERKAKAYDALGGDSSSAWW